MYQNTAHEESPVEVTAPQPTPKPSRRCQKRMVVVQNEDAPQCTTWTTEEEIALCKEYLHNKTKQPSRRTYDMVNGKWKMVRPNVAQFCGVHAKVMRRAQSSGARDEDYFNKALFYYEVEFGVPFTLRHCCSLNTKFGDASINLNVSARDDDEDNVQVPPRPIDRDKAKGLKKKVAGSSGSSASMNDEALARLMLSELATQNKNVMAMKKEECTAFLEIKRREIRIRQKSQENSRKRANTDTRTEECARAGSQSQEKSTLSQLRQDGQFNGSNTCWQSYTSSNSPHWSITSKDDTLAGVEAQRMMGVLKALTEVAQMSQSRIATLAIRVRSFGDLTDENHYPIIGRIQGMIDGNVGRPQEARRFTKRL
ncbi:hypothetical protein Tco_0607166 [Tanacetum coccineum]